MVVAISIVTGFKLEIRNKVTGFGSHIQILNYDTNLSYQTSPIPGETELADKLESAEGVSHVQAFSIKAGIVKTEDQIQGLVLKGIDKDFDWNFLEANLKAGSSFRVSDSSYTNSILISSFLAKKMKLETGDSFQMWFVDKTPRMRKFEVSGIFETSLAEFDETFAFADSKHVRMLNNWEVGQVSGFEVNIEDFADIEDITWNLRDITADYTFDEGSRIKVRNIIELYPQIFDWLDLQDMNVLIIIILMLIVASFNMISGLLILILDRTFLIGVLKSLGARNLMIRKIFLYKAGFLMLRGLLAGNIIGVGLCVLQKEFSLVRLDPASYYLTTVPVNLSLINILAINTGAVVAIMFFLVLPSVLVARISPAKVIRFD